MEGVERVESNPQNVEARYNLALRLERLGRINEAVLLDSLISAVTPPESTVTFTEQGQSPLAGAGARSRTFTFLAFPTPRGTVELAVAGVQGRFFI